MDNRPLDQRCPWILNPEPHSAPRREINLEPMDPGDVVEPDDTATSLSGTERIEMTTRQDGFDDLALAAITDGATPLVRAAVRRVWDLAAEFDVEDGYTIEPFTKRPVSRGDRIRREIATALLGLDDDAHPLIQPHDACQARGCEECEFTGCADAVCTATCDYRRGQL